MAARPNSNANRAQPVEMLCSPSPCKPTDTSTMPTLNSTNPCQSNLAVCWRRSGMKYQLAMKPSTPTGRLMRKTQCQLATSTSQPPSAGPMRGPSRPGMVTKDITRSSSCLL
ncbi:hypothetical protein D3C72_1143980 [compost metagenome]